MKVVGNGSFGVVYSAKLVDTQRLIAIKKVLQDKRFKNRELQIMRKLEHQNVVKLQYFFYSSGDKVGAFCLRPPLLIQRILLLQKDELYLNLILEYIPENVYRVVRVYAKQRQTIPILYVKVSPCSVFGRLRETENGQFCNLVTCSTPTSCSCTCTN